MTRNVVFINSIEKQCGVHSYGQRVGNILAKSIKYNFIYFECNNNDELVKAKSVLRPVAIIYNFHPLPMAWLPPCEDRSVIHLMNWHEGTEHTNLKPDYWLYVDSLIEEKENKFALPRPLIEKFVFKKPKNKVPIISSFGYGWGNKNYGSIIKTVNDQFDKAVIRLHIPRAYYGDKNGEATAGVLPGIWNEMYKPNIKLEITHDFLSDYDLLKFLSQSDLNIFLYEQMEGRGLSSVIDYALSVDVPIAINNSFMFRHVQNDFSNAANNSLQQIIDNGTEHLKQYKEKWSNESLIKKYEDILDKTL